jgi:hypothetical protein
MVHGKQSHQPTHASLHLVGSTDCEPLCQYSCLLSHANQKLIIICTADGATMRLQDYISMTAAANHHNPSAASLLGTVYTEKAFLEKFLLQPASPSTQVQQQSLATSL